MSSIIIHLVEQYGYFLFFLAFSAGPFGIPIPNEVIIISGGVLADAGVLNPWVVYVCILFGLLTAVTLAYGIGSYVGRRLFDKLKAGKRSKRYALAAERLVNKYGNIALILAYFVPIVRYAVPLLIGASGTRYRTFARYSYLGCVVWTVLFFTIGRQWGNEIIVFLQTLNVGSILIVALMAVGLYILTRFVQKHGKHWHF